jgi:hypothetical protein
MSVLGGKSGRAADITAMTEPEADTEGTEIPQCSGLTPHGVRHPLSGSMEEVGGAPTRFRTIQVCPKD